MSAVSSIAARPSSAGVIARVLIVCLLAAGLLPVGDVDHMSASEASHLVVSEVVTGGSSASDELIELYNPTPDALPLEGLELIYVSASGATISRRAAWEIGAAEVPSGAHVLVANELGIYATIADATYATGMAATGGSVALRIQGATNAIDGLGWGTAAGTWLEGTPAGAPPVGGSLERLPGGAAGSTVDTDHNAADFAVRMVPDPQNSASPPVPDPTTPTPTTSPVPTLTPVPSTPPSPPPTATPAPTPAPISIGDARALPDGSAVTVEGRALTASDFTDGGGYVADPGGGIAVLLDGGSFARGEHVIVRGSLDDRFAQRTIRASEGEVTVSGPSGVDPVPLRASTGAVNESVEARLVRIEGTIHGSPTVLSGGLSFEVDDGSGAARVIVGNATGIDTANWTNGAGLVVVGVVGQRDSSGTGTSGYRVQPRDSADVELVMAPTPTPSPGGSPDPNPDASPSTPPSESSVVPIADARAAAKNARVTVRGVVTLPSGAIDPRSAVVQDASGAILLRLGGEAGTLSRGELLEVAGVRSTKSGMESPRVTVPPRRLGSAPDPAPRALRSGDASEASEAQLVVVRGALVASARRASSGTVSFEVDDGSGPLRVVLGRALESDHADLVAGTWIEVSGVLGQETTGAQPLRGYRVWPRSATDLRILASATDGPATGDGTGTAGGSDGGGDAAGPSLAGLADAGLTDARVGATLVASAWPELGVGGLLWDGSRLVGITPASATRLAPIVAGRVAPLSVELLGLREERRMPRTGLALVTLGTQRGDTVIGSSPPDPPSPILPGPDEPPTWVSLVGSVTTERGRTTIDLDGTLVPIERLCRRQASPPDGVAMIVGMAVSSPARVIIGCDAVRPAPALALTHLRRSSGSTPATGASVDVQPGGVAGPRLLAAGLLALGAGIVVIGMVIGRRRGSEEAEEAEVHAAGEPVQEEPGSSAPQLTLVRVPNEHGP